LLKSGRLVEGGDPSPPLSTGEATPGALCPVLGFSVQKAGLGQPSQLLVKIISIPAEPATTYLRESSEGHEDSKG